MARTNADWDLLVPELAPEKVAVRLEAAREALDLSKAEFAQRAHLTPQQYSNILAGTNRLNPHYAASLCKAHRLTMDYVFLGDLSGLPHSIHDDIAARLRIRRNS